jgi:small subunit ribosomal protein S2
MVQTKEKNKVQGEKTIPKRKRVDKEIEKMFKLGVHFGHSHSKKHPKTASFIYGTRNNIDIIDLLETKISLEKAQKYLEEKKKALILFVATKTSAREIIKNLAERLGMPYVIERWLGGTLTNFDIIKKRIDRLKELEEKEKRGEFEKYTKKERIRIDQEIERIDRKLGGLRKLDRLPDILFIVDVKKEMPAIKEAKQKKIPIVGICDTDGDPSLIDYPIIANDDAVSSLEYILKKVEEVFM